MPHLLYLCEFLLHVSEGGPGWERAAEEQMTGPERPPASAAVGRVHAEVRGSVQPLLPGTRSQSQRAGKSRLQVVLGWIYTEGDLAAPTYRCGSNQQMCFHGQLDLCELKESSFGTKLNK